MRTLGWLAVGGLWLALAAGGAIAVVDHLEQDSRFCVACHLPGRPSEPLHQAKYEDFSRQAPESLAAAHRTRPSDNGFQCRDCHQGTGATGRARILAKSARDTAAYLLGAYQEPTHLEAPLEDRDCVKCHAAVSREPSAISGQAETERRFHGLRPHQGSFPVRCTACHLVHRPGGSPARAFVIGAEVLPVCRRCHTGLAGNVRAVVE